MDQCPISNLKIIYRLTMLLWFTKTHIILPLGTFLMQSVDVLDIYFQDQSQLYAYSSITEDEESLKIHGLFSSLFAGLFKQIPNFGSNYSTSRNFSNLDLSLFDIPTMLFPESLDMSSPFLFTGSLPTICKIYEEYNYYHFAYYTGQKNSPVLPCTTQKFKVILHSF